jgi:hypothetical protein
MERVGISRNSLDLQSANRSKRKSNTNNFSSVNPVSCQQPALWRAWLRMVASVAVFGSFASTAAAQGTSLGNFVMEPAFVAGQAHISGKNCALSRERSKTWVQAITCKNPGQSPVEFKSDAWTPSTYIANRVSDAIRQQKLPFTPPQIANRETHIVRTIAGVLDTNTLGAVCSILGYSEYVSSSDVEPNDGRCNFTTPADDYLWRFNGQYKIVTPTPSTQCTDGIDNDGDGLVDALVELPSVNGITFTFGGNSTSAEVMRAAVAANIRDKKLNMVAPSAPIVRSDTGWDTIANPGLDYRFQIDGLNAVCRAFGYAYHTASTCRDDERSGRYPYGKCNFHTPGDNQLSRFNGNGFYPEGAEPKFGKTWLTGITCQNLLSACNDGVDNDNDGKTDLADDGCASPNDNDERPHDPTCTSPTYPTEFAQCSDKIDNDADGLTDRDDPGCWKDPSNPNTYDPNLDNEAVATTQCQDTKDNDGDTLIDAKDPGCFKDPKNPATYDRTRNNEALVGPGECMDGKDNDNDGVADAQDPGCWKDPNNPNSYDQYGGPESSATTQCQDTKDNDGDALIDAKDPGCFTNPRDPATYDRTRNSEALAGPGECMDGKDNDNDGVADAQDPGCWKDPNNPNSYNPYGGPESSATTQCQDTKDNDGDALIDAKDPGCFANPRDPATYDRTRNSEALAGPGECMDGKDNDNDGVADAQDPGCWKDPNNPNSYDQYGGPESSATTQCQDAKDNDGDVVVDKEDPGCWTDPKNPATYDRTRNREENATTQCQDTLDNDGDGVIDSKDPGCWKDTSNAATYDRTLNNEANATTQCQDTKDNDGDSLIDDKDPGCWTTPSDPKTYDKTRNDESANGKSQCADGIDNDKDGVADKDDPGCWKDPKDPSTFDPQRNDESAATTQCQDGIDNDDDNAIDMQDPGCESPIDNDESGEQSLFTVGVECVVDNKDNTKTAYFSYNNTTGTDLSFTTNADLNTLNEFVVGSGSKNAPPTIFKPGQNKGSVVATFSSDSLTWVTRAPKSALSQATANGTTPRCAPVAPVAECRGYVGGVMTVRLGYTNPNAFEQVYAVGPNNLFTPGAANRGQPSRFFAGNNKSVFELALASENETLTWSINGSSVTITPQLPACSGECTDTPTGAIKGDLDQIASDLSDVMNRAAQILASAKASLTREQIQRNKRDAERAKRKAAEYEQLAKALTIQFPAVVKTCPSAPPLCVSVDRGPTLDALRSLYANQRNSVMRTIARAYWRNINKTKRNDKNVAQAKELEQLGLVKITELPRIVVECK